MRRRTAKRLAATLEPLEPRLCLASSNGWDGFGRGAASLTYYIGNAPSSLSQAAVNAALKAALNVWSSVADIRFTQTSQPNQPKSIDFTFRPIDGPGGTLAQAYFPDDVNPPRIAGDVQFDSSDRWEVGNALGRAAFDLVSTAVHEIGHALGLDHSGVAGSVMADSISPNQAFTGLAPTDVNSILALYAPATVKTTSTSPTAAPLAGATDPANPSNPGNNNPVNPTAPRSNRMPRFPWFSSWSWRQRVAWGPRAQLVPTT